MIRLTLASRCSQCSDISLYDQPCTRAYDTMCKLVIYSNGYTQWAVIFNVYGEQKCIELTWECTLTLFMWQVRQWGEALQQIGRQDRTTLASLLRNCTGSNALSDGRHVHAQIRSSGQEGDTLLGNLLVQMYGKCGSVEDARAAFENIHQRNVYSWTLLMTAYAQNGQFYLAMKSFREMDCEGIKPSSVTFLALVGVCTSLCALSEGITIHARASASGFMSDMVLCTALLNMYSKCGSLHHAEYVFQSMSQRDVVSWNSMIIAYTQYGFAEDGIELYKRMVSEGIEPDRTAFLSVFAACSCIEDAEKVHQDFLKRHFAVDTVVGNSLIFMYENCGSLETARRVFDEMECVDVVSWNVIVAAYARRGSFRESLYLFRRMEQSGIKGDIVTFLNILSGCTDAEEGKKIHTRVVSVGFESDALTNTIMHMYCKCGKLDDAMILFEKMLIKTVVSWTVMMAAYAENGYQQEVLQFYVKMDLEGLQPDEITYTTVLEVCCDEASLCHGKCIHQDIIESGFESSRVVACALVNMYGKSGSVENAKDVFSKIRQKDVVACTAMITAYALHGDVKASVELLRRMDVEGIKPSNTTFVSIMNACTVAGRFNEGNRIHFRCVLEGNDTSMFVATSLVSFYGKCGKLDKALEAFRKIEGHGVVACWNAIISSYCQQGFVYDARTLFNEMCQDGLKPNEITFVCMLFGCSHGGLVKAARECFHSMIQDHGISATMDHYGCLADILGRAGHLDKVEDLLQCMPFQPSEVPWKSLLVACGTQSDVQRGARAAQQAVEMNSTEATPYVLLSNVWRS